MSARVYERPIARKDFWEIVEYLASQSVNAAERFIDAVEASQSFLADFPIAGCLIEDETIAHKNVRISQVRGFRNYLIVFRATEDRVEILRYTNATRDLNSLLRDL